MSRSRRSLAAALDARFVSTSTRFPSAPRFNGDPTDTERFPLNEPTVFPKIFANTPAIRKWFTPLKSNESFHGLNVSYLSQHGSAMVPLELTRYNTSEPDGRQRTSFERFEAPLSLLLAQMSQPDNSLDLYLAQCPLDLLPSELRADLPHAPSMLSHIGRGDIYASSLWMGRPPTITPLHRDPNPNLFIQLAGRKVIRLMRPEQGRALYDQSRSDKGHAHMRGEEMMVGEEMERLQEAVWNDSSSYPMGGVEAELESGHALFIPQGWWHAVQGYGPGANASVNWWFR